jgi:hypothetical protein
MFVGLEDRFWSKVQKCEHGDDCAECCWLWQAGVNHLGYGYLKINGRKVRVHIMSYELAKGPRLPIPGLCVLHRCDSPACVNPHHLWLGTQSDNMLDKSTKGRTGRAKLSDIEVAEIKLLINSGDHTQAEVAAWYNVAPGTISDINQGRTHRHIAPPA